MPGKDGSYAVQLAWKDGQGTVHRFGPVAVSEAFWSKIARKGELVVHQTAIRYRQDDPQMRPLIVEDAPEQHWQTRFGMGAGLLLLILGAAVLFSGLRTLRNASSKR